MRIATIIPARGGSRGVPNKNIHPLAGKPLIAYTIEASLEADLETFVSTDSEKIAKVSEELGALVIPRPEKLSTDTSTSEDTLIHAVEEIEKKGRKLDWVVFLQCTSPLRGSKEIKEAVKLACNGKYDSVITVHPTFGYFGKFEAGYYIPFRKERKRRQEMEPWYRDNGAAYVVKRDVLLKEKNRYGHSIGMVEMSELDSWEIDSEIDFWIVEKIIELKKAGGKQGFG